MIVLARLEAEHSTMQEVLADLDKAQDAISSVLADGTEISDEHYERMAAGEAHPSYFKGRRVFKIPPIVQPRAIFTFAGQAATAALGGTNPNV